MVHPRVFSQVERAFRRSSGTVDRRSVRLNFRVYLIPYSASIETVFGISLTIVTVVTRSSDRFSRSIRERLFASNILIVFGHI